ncbi:MAG TPA: crosslink repair DNA glycosylase YcaQ family protein [Anaerolineales bacterium]|nr:crosslink repair DNA glycosylase YcaQ family protein [Anaerolineales bacterium]
MNTIYDLPAVRALALHAQGLTTPNGLEGAPTREVISATVKQLGCVQLDTLQMVRRSHYLVLWSRLGRYDPADFDRLIYDPNERRLFEGWQHAASIIPLEDYRYQIPHMRRLRENPAGMSLKWLQDPESSELLHKVMERIRQNGPVRAADFEYKGPKRGSWWDWKPAKNALEHLYAWGDLMIADRLNFQRVYDLRERVLPNWVDTSEPTREERNHYWIEQAVRALGICQPIQLAEYTFLKRGQVRTYLEHLIKEGTLIGVQARMHDRMVYPLVVHRESLPLLSKAGDGALNPGRTTFLSRSTTCSGRVAAMFKSGISATSWKRTNRKRSAFGVISACPSCTETDWLAGLIRS